MSATTRVRLLRGSGVLLFLLGIVHLVATPHIAAFIRQTVAKGAADTFVPPMLLNHVLVGVLLLPLGYLTVYAAPQRAPWAQIIIRVTALTVATLPVTVLALMGVSYFDAPLFLVGFLLAVAASGTLLWAAFTRTPPNESLNQIP